MSKRTKLSTLVASCVECAWDNGLPIATMSQQQLTSDLLDRSICGNYAPHRVARAVRAFHRSRRHKKLQSAATAAAP